MVNPIKQKADISALTIVQLNKLRMATMLLLLRKD